MGGLDPILEAIAIARYPPSKPSLGAVALLTTTRPASLETIEPALAFVDCQTALEQTI